MSKVSVITEGKVSMSMKDNDKNSERQDERVA